MDDGHPDTSSDFNQYTAKPGRVRWHILIDFISFFIHNVLKTYIFTHFETYYLQTCLKVKDQCSLIQPCFLKLPPLTKERCGNCTNHDKCTQIVECIHRPVLPSRWCENCRIEKFNECKLKHECNADDKNQCWACKNKQREKCTHKNDCSKKTLMSKDWCQNCLKGNEEKCHDTTSRCQQNSIISKSDWCKECREKPGQDCTNRQKVPCAKKRELILCHNCLKGDSQHCLNIKSGCSKCLAQTKNKWCESCQAWKREIEKLLRETCKKTLSWGTCDTSLFSKQDSTSEKTTCINIIIKTFIPEKNIKDHPLNDLGNCLLVIEMCNLFPDELGTHATSFRQHVRNPMHHNDELVSEDEEVEILKEFTQIYECMKTIGLHNNDTKNTVQQIKEHIKNNVYQLSILKSMEHDQADTTIHLSRSVCPEQAKEIIAVQASADHAEHHDSATKDHERESRHQIADNQEGPSNRSSTKQFDDMEKYSRMNIQEKLRAEIKNVKDASKQQIRDSEDRISELQSQLEAKEKALTHRDKQIDAVLNENKMHLEKILELQSQMEAKEKALADIDKQINAVLNDC